MIEELTLEQKELIKKDLEVRSKHILNNFKTPVDRGIGGAITGRLKMFEPASKLVVDELNVIISENGYDLTKDAQDDLVSFLKPTITSLLKNFIQPK